MRKKNKSSQGRGRRQERRRTDREKEGSLNIFLHNGKVNPGEAREGTSRSSQA